MVLSQRVNGGRIFKPKAYLFLETATFLCNIIANACNRKASLTVRNPAKLSGSYKAAGARSRIFLCGLLNDRGCMRPVF
jgi:hypothetical protein